MALEVHRVVEESDNLHGAGAEPIEENVPRGPATLGEVLTANARANIVARLSTSMMSRFACAERITRIMRELWR